MQDLLRIWKSGNTELCSSMWLEMGPMESEMDCDLTARPPEKLTLMRIANASHFQVFSESDAMGQATSAAITHRKWLLCR